MSRTPPEPNPATGAPAPALRDWFERWLNASGSGAEDPSIEYSAVSGDASFRRYYRARLPGASYILVDAPPDREDSRPFVHVARLMEKQGVRVPKVYQADFSLGFMCLSDLGDLLLWEKLARAGEGQKGITAAGELYHRAFGELLKIQRCASDGDYSFPPYNEKLLHAEMKLFEHWFCQSLLGLSLDAADLTLLAESFHLLAESALAQEQLCVHRDYHSRNLLYQDGAIGVVDFQDAVTGPATYDLVSLLKDCYIAWPREAVEGWALNFLEMAEAEGLLRTAEPQRFLEDFDLMGMQRHLKAVGIFSRLYLRDGKPGYLPDIPRTLDYVRETCTRHEGLRPFGQWLERRVMPVLGESLADARDRRQ